VCVRVCVCVCVCVCVYSSVLCHEYVVTVTLLCWVKELSGNNLVPELAPPLCAWFGNKRFYGVLLCTEEDPFDGLMWEMFFTACAVIPSIALKFTLVSFLVEWLCSATLAPKLLAQSACLCS